MSLRTLNLPSVIDTSTFNLTDDFFAPALAVSSHYDRGVGYFSSGWLRVNAEGMSQFASNRGYARWITSPILDEDDWTALKQGTSARTDLIVYEALQRNIEELTKALESDTLSALAWMVADRIIDFRLALPRNKLSGEFHAKFGIFTDTYGNVISFNGSYNDSIQGLLNYESLDIFCSWKSEFLPLVEATKTRFERLWANQDPNVKIFDLPEAAKAQILKLRNYKRPYSEPRWIGSSTDVPKWADLWPNQQEAIVEWEKSRRRGLISMATGSGKTRTALLAAVNIPDLSLLVIAVPRSNLVEQWAGELAEQTNLQGPILVYQNSSVWQDKLFNRLRAAQSQDWPQTVTIIGTMTSLSGERFSSVLDDIEIPPSSLIIVDEVHNIGAPTYRRILKPEFQWRLGMSATPARHFDEEGTATIENYFERLVYVYGLSQALQDGRLSPYYYHVYVSELSEEEFQDYLDTTQQIVALRKQLADQTVTYQTDNALDGDSEDIKRLLFHRARILKKTASKTQILEQVLKDHPPERCLVYCADKEQLQVVGEVMNSQHITHLQYIGNTPVRQRSSALEALENGRLPVLLAIDCLDEGVDIPAVDMAIILASSSNKRQFVQRRGRILRRAVGKKSAKLIDVIAVPPYSVGKKGKWMLNGELARAKEMAELAENRHEALLNIKKHLEPYGVMLTELLSGEYDD